MGASDKVTIPMYYHISKYIMGTVYQTKTFMSPVEKHQGLL